MFDSVKIAPSILSANFLKLGDDISMIEKGGAEVVHVDVMDGHFVPNLTMGVPIIKQLKTVTTLPLDVHLMISNPIEQLEWFCKAGCDSITIHAEPLSAEEMVQAVKTIHDSGIKAAVSVKPKTPTSVLEPVIADIEMVLIMSVEPGFSGQSYIEGSEDKVAEVCAMARACGNDALKIQVDGGISAKTAARVAAQGADVLVCGSAVFGQEDPAAAIEEIKRIANDARVAAIG